jgi:putative hemolysin
VEFVLLAVCWSFIAFFELAEMSLVSSNRRRLARLAEQGSKGAQTALALLANPDRKSVV